MNESAGIPGRMSSELCVVTRDPFVELRCESRAGLASVELLDALIRAD
jgi:hypothetical protein